jgi:hypothetical protein
VDLSAVGMLSSLPYLMVIAFIWFIYVAIMRQKYSKEAEGCIWGEFFCKNGQSYGALCKVDKGCVDAPKGHEIGTYFTSNECTYDFQYPPGKMRLMQTRIRRSVWLENNPVPRVSTEPEKWIESEDLVKITSYMIETAANESFQKSAMEMQKTFWGEISAIAKFVKNVPYIMYIGIGACAVAGIGAYFAYMSYAYLISRFP